MDLQETPDIHSPVAIAAHHASAQANTTSPEIPELIKPGHFTLNNGRRIAGNAVFVRRPASS